MKQDRLNKFSVPLGLLDYVNPVMYTITMSVILRNIYGDLSTPYNKILLAGAIISILFGLVIPTGKVIVGLGIIQFVMPVSLVFIVNAGILLSGSMLLKYTLNLSLIPMLAILAVIAVLLAAAYKKSRKINTIAVLTGAFGYLMIYFSLILMSVKRALYLPILLYALAILLFIMLCGIGINANLKNPKVHWVIEASNVLCQTFVAVATVLLFR